MQYTNLSPQCGLKVSRIALGTMQFGYPEWAGYQINGEEAYAVLRRARELGINFFDTADGYSDGDSERVLGEWMKKDSVPREEIVIATKVYCYIDKSGVRAPFGSSGPKVPNLTGLSRKHIMHAVEDSLKRLGTDYIDLYQIHRFDPETPIRETMEALHDLVKAGKIRYIGASSMYAWQFQTMQNEAEKYGLTKLVSMQNVYNALYREEEREMHPYLLSSGIRTIPWSPLAASALSIDPEVAKPREAFSARFFDRSNEPFEGIKAAVGEIAAKKNATRSQVALAWLLSKPIVSSPIIGTSKIDRLEEMVAALDLKLTEEEIQQIEKHYKPQAIFGH